MQRDRDRWIEQINVLQNSIEGEITSNNLTCILYATDASAYREMPIAVAFPKVESDIEQLIRFANDNNQSLIARGAGTSLAGQVVGSGIVVDFSKHFNSILEINTNERWVRVQPGVVLAELNKQLLQHGLQFGPETSTANFCTIGGMVGNNSCGLHSLVHGSVREHLLEVSGFLSDGTKATFGQLTLAELQHKCLGDKLENRIYRTIYDILSSPENQALINAAYPDTSVMRRNHGYALDILASSNPFCSSGSAFNLCKLIAGSEGTLFVATEIKLNIIPLPPKQKALACIHFDNLSDALKANLVVLKHQPSAIELMDKTILDCTLDNISQRRNRFFIKGDPAAILIAEFWNETESENDDRIKAMQLDMEQLKFGYHFAIVRGNDIAKVWNLRKSGLGVLSNMPGDAKPVSVVEDTAIPVEKLPEFVTDFAMMLNQRGLKSVYHGHIATGELHLRPVLNLKSKTDVELFRDVAIETAKLVKKYRGSLSGEHGDGRLRGEFIPFMLGEKVFSLLKQVKVAFDPNNRFNPGKIIDTPPMNSALRFNTESEYSEVETYFDFSHEIGVRRAIEKCNGSADCRKSEIVGGTMCPSFMATRNELHSTRGRANVLRELLAFKSIASQHNNIEVLQALDLCLMCKACKSECPSGIDMAKLKAEFLQQHYKHFGVPFRTKLIGAFPLFYKLAARIPAIANFILQNQISASLLKWVIGLSQKRSFPTVSIMSLSCWYERHSEQNKLKSGKTVFLYNDEFLNTTDSAIGIKAILLLEALGYHVVIPSLSESGRTYLSKGMLAKARAIAQKNVNMLFPLLTDETPLIGIEPSAILSFRDEYPDLVGTSLKQTAIDVAKKVFLIEEFLVSEFEHGKIDRTFFTEKHCSIRFHGHCHQKAITDTSATRKMLEIPINYKVEEIKSGCCGMAGSFGFEKEHYELSMQIGELVLFPEVRKTDIETLIVANGTSCREHIADGTGRKAFHPIEALWEALKNH